MLDWIITHGPRGLALDIFGWSMLLLAWACVCYFAATPPPGEDE